MRQDADRYSIHAGYRARVTAPDYDDTKNTDEYQRDVYGYAEALFHRLNLRGVCDVGCGSGYKLVEFFRNDNTLGIDRPPVIEFLRAKYPGRDWRVAALDADTLHGFDLLICADIIEHLADPDDLLGFIRRSNPKRAIISTPERGRLYDGRRRHGPPKNIHHVREWDYWEFHDYIVGHFEICEHFAVGATQVIDCRMRQDTRSEA